jgi:uncharacterized GH25 family protein
MKPRTPIIAAAVLLAAAATWFFLLRGHGKAARTGAPAVTAGSGSSTGKPNGARPDGPERGPRGGGDPMAVQVDDDPVGAQRLEGLVLTADEQPVAGATVSISSNPPRTATTQTDGSFAFDKLVGRPYTLVARAAAGVAGPITTKASAATGVVVLHLRAAGAVVVTVVDGKSQPVAGAEVELRGLDRQGAATGADGVARFTPVVPGPYDVAAHARGYAPAFAFRPVTPGQVEVTMVLRPGAPVSGKVVDARGTPVAGARVIYAGASDWGSRPDERLDGVVSAADGTWRFEAIGAGSFRFQARHPSHAPGTSPLISLDGVTARDGVEVTMPVGATVRGKVVDASQQPVASAQVRIGDASRNMIGEAPRQVMSADDGTFVIEGLPRKPLVAVAMAETAASATVPVDTTAGDVTDLVLTVDVTGVIAGVVVDRAGEPLDGVQVSAAPDFRGGNFDPQQFRLRGLIQDLTDADGHFELVGLAAGSYSVRASRTAAGRGRMFGPDGETAKTGTRDLRIVLPADGGVKGKVAFADGTAPVGFGVSVGFAQDQPGGKDGAFEIGDLPPRDYRVTVHGSDFDDKTVEAKVEEGKVVDVGTITVVKGRRIGGRVTFNGQPVAGATVYAGGQIFGSGSSNEAPMGGPPGRGSTRTTTTDDDGTWSLSGVGPTALAVVADKDGVGRSAARRVVRNAPDEQQLELALAAFGSLSGTVRDADGPAGNRIVTVQSVTTPNAMYGVASGPDGVYRLDKLAPDRYKVSAMLGMPGMRGGMKLQSLITTVASGAEAHLDLATEKGTLTVTVRAVPPAGVTADQVRGVCWLLTGTYASGTVDQLTLASAGAAGSTTLNIMFGGTATFNDVLPGTYSACAAPLPKDIPGGPMAGQEYFARHADTLQVVCKPLTLAAQPPTTAIDIPVEIPPLATD